MRSSTTLARARPVWLTVATFLGFFLLGYGGIFIVGGNAHSSSPIWPATAFGFVMMLRLARSRGDDVAMLAAMFAASLLANKLGGAAPLVSLGFSLINVMDVAAGIAIMRRLGKPRLNTMMRVARFMLVAGIAPSLFGASLSALLIAWVGGNPWLTGLQWMTSNLLGILILFPFGLTVSLRQFAKLRLQHRFLEAGLLFFTIAVLAYLTFNDRAPLLFLVLVGTMAASARFRLLGAGASLIVVAAIAFAAVHAHAAPHNLVWIEWLQFFLAVSSIVSVRTAMLLNERDLHLALIERRHRRVVRASRFKSQLLAHVSHEVRSPLSAIIGFSSMLESGSLQA